MLIYSRPRFPGSTAGRLPYIFDKRRCPSYKEISNPSKARFRPCGKVVSTSR